MKIVQINSVLNGSTGSICRGISDKLNLSGIENYILFSPGEATEKSYIKCAGRGYIKAQALKSRILGNYGFNSTKATRKMIAHLEEIKPDIVHLHNLHGHDCDLNMLLSYLKERQIKLVWTFHDCWAFTAYCPHFEMQGCSKWMTGCESCPQRESFAWFSDRSAELYSRKKELLSGLKLTVVTPSYWLYDCVRRSLLKDCPVKVINNGIDLSVFKPTASDIRKKLGIPEDKAIILGVAAVWCKSKGLDVFIELAKRLPEDKYRIVLVGTDGKTERLLPDNVIAVSRTENKAELASLYTAADVFVNPTREDSFPTVNIEALACGSPVLTFKTGGSPEIIDFSCGSAVGTDDLKALASEIERIVRDKPYTRDDCRKRAERFSAEESFKKYLQLYGDI